jgi:hypothetical protein
MKKNNQREGIVDCIKYLFVIVINSLGLTDSSTILQESFAG